MSTASAGRAREYKVRDHMIEAGWEFIMRSAGSKGPADLLLAHPDYGAALVQVGTHGKHLNEAGRDRLLHAAWLCSALPIVAHCYRTIAYWEVGPGPLSTWKAWTP